MALYRRRPQVQYRRRRSSFFGGRLLIAAVLVVVSLVSYWGMRDENPITGEVQHVALSVEQEIGLGLQAAPEMAAQHGGLDPDPQAQARVDDIGRRLVQASPASDSPYRFEFHLLADPQTVNAFALPGGQIFITRALYDRFETEGQLAGVLGHEVGHVIERHSAQQIAKARLTEGLTGAAVVATYDPGNPRSMGAAAMAALVGQMVNMKYGRDDELESDKWGVRTTADAGYDPRAMIRVMEILRDAGGPNRQPEFFSTHPNPENRIERIEAAIREVFPDGVPENLEP